MEIEGNYIENGVRHLMGQTWVLISKGRLSTTNTQLKSPELDITALKR